MSALVKTWLIQRLEKPTGRRNPFSFGGGLVNGGLSNEAMDLLCPIFSFDYMGSSEFEHGAIPRFFQTIGENSEEYTTSEMSVNSTKIYIICRSRCEDEVKKRIYEIAHDRVRTKEHVGLNIAVGLSEWYRKENCPHIGWLEIENEFMFFVSKEAFEKTARLFEIIPEEA
jgi:hypothetical protein